MRKTLSSLALILGLVASSFGTTASGAAPASFADFFVDRHDHFDARAASRVTLSPTAAQVRAIRALVAEHHDVTIDWNPTFGTVRTVLRHTGTLTGPAGGRAEDAAAAWLRAHAGLYGWTGADVTALRVVKALQQPGHGPKYVLFHQVFGGLEGGSFGGSTLVALDDANRILSVRSNVVPGTGLVAGVRIDEARALSIVSGIEAPRPQGKRGTYTAFAPGGMGGPHFVRRVAFPMPGAPARPALEISFARRMDEGYRIAVDAITGKVLYRHPLVAHQAEPEGRVFRNYPGAPDGGGEHELVSFAGDPDASPFGWGPGGAPLSAGNNAHTATNWTPSGILVPDGNQARWAGTFDVPFSDAWAESNCGANPVGSPQTPTYAVDTPAAIVNLFYHHNISHDYWWKLGFTGPAGAMQAVNFEDPGAGELSNDPDPLLGMVQAAAVGGDLPPDDPLGRDNAYMFSNDDPLPSWSAMFLFQPIPPVPPSGGGFLAACVDGDFAADVIHHEYAHGVTNRWVGGEFGNLETIQGGSMGESWGDLYGTHYLHSEVGVRNTNLASYDTGTMKRSFRNFDVDKGYANYGDLGYDITGEEVHADGEIWNSVIWDLRAELMKRTKDKGAYAMQLVADAMPTAGPSPSMLDMRNAILLADRARTKGRYQTILWSVFARHGMGRTASSGQGGSAGGWDGAAIDPKGRFDHFTRSLNSTVNGRVVDSRTGAPVKQARVIIGRFEARVTPQAVTSGTGAFTFPVMGGRPYPLTIAADGYGVQRTTITPRAGKPLNLRIGLSVNLASKAAGASIKEVSNPSTLGPPAMALDDTQASVWWTDADETAVGESFVVDLAGKAPVALKRLQISAMRGTGGSRFDALKDYEILASTNGRTFKSIAKGTFDAPPPRPLVVDLLMRTITLKKPVKATHLKLIGSPQADWGGGLQVAELEAFGTSDIVVKLVKQVPDKAIHMEGHVSVPGADANLTYTLMSNVACEYPPPTQGLDAYVFELPDSYGDGFHLVDVQLVPDVPDDPRPDVDLYFLSATCAPTGDIASTAPREAGTISTGTKYVVALLYTAGPGTMILDATDSK
jgi:extracellular elastinolytic metalloproteinase